MRLAAVAVLVLLAGEGWAQPSPFLTAPNMDRGEQMAALPEGDGREVVQGVCSGCHSIHLVTQQRLSRQRWDELLVWMVEEQGMAELDAETRDTVLDYLAAKLAP